MKSFAPQLPTVLGSFAAMLVAFLSLTTGASPSTCIIKAMAAFLVFAGFGLIVRYAVADSLIEGGERHEVSSPGSVRNMGSSGGLDVIVPGSSVADLLNDHINDPMHEENPEEEADGGL